MPTPITDINSHDNNCNFKHMVNINWNLPVVDGVKVDKTVRVLDMVIVVPSMAVDIPIISQKVA